MDRYDMEKAIHYYYAKIQETNDPYYWYCLADAQVRAGLNYEALQTIGGALRFAEPYPSKQHLLEMQRYLQTSQTNTTRATVVAAEQGDVTGDGVMDNVLLTADKTPDSPFWQNITLVIQNGSTHQSQQIPLKNNAGYNPTLFLGDFTGDKVDDIQVVIDTGGSGGGIYAYIFSSSNGGFRHIFDSDAFNETYQYDVNYENNYKASVISRNLKKRYIIDLTYKGKDYLSEIYNSNGELKQPIEGWVNPLSGLYPIDFDRDGTYNLLGYQRIAGRYNADSLGYVMTELKWNGQAFTHDQQSVAITGGDI